jgi:protein ImuB
VGDGVPAVAATALTLSRPAWLLRAPQPLPAQDGLPVLDGRPLRLLLGPERIEAGWWDANLVARDYFVAADADGALVWVWRHRLPGPQGSAPWYLQGRFG